MRYLNERLLVLMIHFYPELAYLFSINKRLPCRRHKIAKLKSPLMDFSLNSELSDPWPELDEINIILRGESFDIQKLSRFGGPVYYVNATEKFNQDNIFYVATNQKMAKKFLHEGMLPIILIQHIEFDNQGVMQKEKLTLDPVLKNLFNDPDHIGYRIVMADRYFPYTALSAGLICVAAFSLMFKKVNIHGWDHYMDMNPAECGYWQTLFGLASFQKIAIPEWGKRNTALDIVESALFNWCYAHRLKKLPNIDIQGQLGQLAYHPKIMDRIERVFYKF